MIPIASTKRIDWNSVRADYISGSSYGALSKHYGISKSTIFKKSQKERWDEQRERTANAVITKTIQKTADAISSNAAKLERAKGLAIDRLIKALEQMPEKTGTHSRQTIQDGSKRMTVDYDLLEIVSALEKLQKSDTTATDEPVKVIIDV